MRSTLYMAFLAYIGMKRESSALKAKIIEVVAPLKENVSFWY